MKSRRILLLVLAFATVIGYRLYLSGEKNHILEDNSMAEVYDDIIGEDEEYGPAMMVEVDDESAGTDNIEPIFSYDPLTEEIIERIMGISYKENVNIKLEDLAYLQVTHWGFDDREYLGELIVNKMVAENLLEIFEELYKVRFPIEKIRLVDEYGGDDDLSMSDNNTSSFCYREIAGSGGKISNHSYGIAIDINPVQNPYIKNNIILPKEGKEYLDRDYIRKGMIIKGDDCYNAFISRGWTWGGEWKSLKDYQHFEIKLSDIY